MNDNAVVAIGLHPKLHPAGSEMLHDVLGWVAVLKARGNERLVRAFEFVDDPEPELVPGEDPEAVLTAYRILPRDVWVGVNTLHVVRDPELLRPERLRMTFRHGSMFRLADEVLPWSVETPEQARLRRHRSKASRSKAAALAPATVAKVLHLHGDIRASSTVRCQSSD